MSESEIPQDHDSHDSVETDAWNDEPLETPSNSEISTVKAVPNPAIWESIAPKEDADDGRLPENVKIAGALLIAHGACLALNSFLWRDPAQGNNLDSTDFLRGLLWFGATFFMAGGLFERRIWAWWTATLLGGSVGVANALAIVGFFVSGQLNRGETLITARFIVPVIACAAFVMLISTALLLTAPVKRAFGMTKENPTGLF